MRGMIFGAALALGLALLVGPSGAAEPVSQCAQNVAHLACATELTPSGVSTATESGHVIKAVEGVLSSFQVNNWLTSSGLTIMALDATAVPSNGTLATCTGIRSQTNPCVMKWYGIAAAPSASQSTSYNGNYSPGPLLHFLNGLVFVCSSTGPTTLTLSANCTFSAEVQ
jgi:hypothetical protein